MKPTRIYSLPRTLSEEEIAVVMAKTSRSASPFDEIAQEITKEKAADFHTKYVVSYGHASVAECAVPNFVFENVSILASKILESLPRPAYQESSTRYQDFSKTAPEGSGTVYDSYYIPNELRKLTSPKPLNKYITWMDHLFAQYNKFKEAMFAFADKAVSEDEKARANKVRIKAFDSLRYILPIGTTTNLGMRINGRDCAWLISLLLSSEIEEFRVIGEKLKVVATEQLPALVRHADVNGFVVAQRELIKEKARTFPTAPLDEELRDRNYVRVVPMPGLTNGYAARLIAATMLSHRGHGSVLQIINELYESSAKNLIASVMDTRGEHDHFPDEFQVVSFLADMVMDYGAYRDLQRHRRCGQFPQYPTIELGFEVPEGFDQDIEVDGLPLRFQYEKLMNLAKEVAQEMHFATREDPVLFGTAFYMLPLAFRHRVTMSLDLQQAGYMIELRSRPQGHISYRRIVSEMYRELHWIYPDLARWIRCHEVP